MKRRQTKSQKIKDYFDAFKCIQEDRKVKRQGAKDGSIPTYPVVDIPIIKSEKFITADCLAWLRKRGILCNRHDAGTFQNIRGQWGSYGIIGAGDIIGLLKTGQHFELEIKKGNGGRLSLVQQTRMGQIRENNGIFLIIHGIQELEYYFKGLI